MPIAPCVVRKNTQYAIRNTQYGLTLLELMLVVMIILVLVTVSTPLFRRTYEDLRLTSSAKELATMMRFCQERAIFERRVFRMDIDADKRTYQVLAEDKDKEEILPLKSKWGRIFRIPEGIEVEVNEEEILFSADGSTTPVLIYLTNKDEKTFSILIEQDTGFVRVYDYKKE